MKILAKLLTSNGLESFLTQKFARFPYSCPGVAAGLTDLLNWEVVESIIKEKRSILRVVKDGVMTRDYAELSFKEALDYYEKGHTLLFKNAEASSTKLSDLAQDFSQDFYSEVDIQLYCTPEGHNAFGWHYDVEEVFILQTKGSKLYSLRPNTVHPKPLATSIPKDQGYEKETSDFGFKILLKEGDFLYIPSGWWHCALTESESMHISIGLMPRSALDIVNYLPTYLAPNLFWRTRLPIHKDFIDSKEELAFYRDAFRTLGKDLRAKFKEDQFIMDFLQHLKGGMKKEYQ